jgi:hypothetical protein
MGVANTRFEPLDDTQSAIDPPPGRPPTQAGAGARSADAWLRSIAAASALALAAHAAQASHSSGWMALVLAVAAVSCWLGAAPRTTTLAIAVAGEPIAASSAGAAATLLFVSVCGARLGLQLGAAGPWLRDVRRCEARRARALVATGLARSRPDAAARTAAGDHLEREGVARRALAALGATPSRWLDPLLPAAEGVGKLLRGLPRVRDALERAAAG